MSNSNILRYVLFLLIMVLPLSARCDNIVFEGQAPATVVVGDKFQLVYSVNASASDIRHGIQDVFEVLMGPAESTYQSTSIINGNVSTSRTTKYTFVLRAQKEGQFQIPPARVTVNGQQIQSNAVNIRVVSAGASSQSSTQQNSKSSGVNSSSSGNSSDIIIEQSLSRSSVYEGEGVVLVTKIYTRANLQSISDVKQPDLTQFVISDLTDGGQLQFNDEVRDGLRYHVAVSSRQLIIPQKSGNIKIDPIEYEFIVKQRSSNNAFFGGFFDDVQLVRRRVKSNSLTLVVKSIPQSNVKTSGGVGDFKFNVTVSPNEVDVDNSVQVKISVSGEGNLKLLSMPRPQIHSDFDTFDPNETSNIESTSRGYKGSRFSEYLIIPRREGDFVIPEIKFVYFDPSSGQYVTKTQGPFNIHVNKGSGASSNNPISFSGGSREQVQYLGRDLRYVRQSTTDLSDKKTFFVLSPLFFACLVLALLLFAAMSFYYKKKEADSNNVSGVKKRRANKAAKKRLKRAAQYMKEDKRDAFFDEVMRALWGYLSDKLTLPLSVLTKDNAIEEMQKHSIDIEVAQEFMQLLDSCEFARYAPIEMAEPMEQIYSKAENVIGNIDGCIK